MHDLIRLGSCFVAYKVDKNEYRFAPSRFIGYVNNNLIKHNKAKNEHQVDGRKTNPVIGKLLNQKLSEDKKLEKKYLEYCELLDIEPTKKKENFGSMKRKKQINLL